MRNRYRIRLKNRGWCAACKAAALSFVFIFTGFDGSAQEVVFFSEGTTASYYDQGLVNVGDMGSSTFEHTYPPGLPQYNDKIPCGILAFSGVSAMKFNYFSSSAGTWKATVYRSDWSTADLSALDSVSFYLYSSTAYPATALPLIAVKAVETGGSAEVASSAYSLSAWNPAIPAGQWTRVTFPLSVMRADAANSSVDWTRVKAIQLIQSENTNTSRLVYLDELTAFKSLAVVPAVTGLTAAGFDSHAELNWQLPAGGLKYRVYASFDGGQTFSLRGQTTSNFYLDFVPQSARNSTVVYRVVAVLANRESAPSDQSATIRDYTDDELLDLIQRYTFRYFWEGAHQASGMALERTSGSTTAASGATGMGLMALIVAHERQYQPQDDVKERILKILDFLANCDRYHGAWSHWYNADSRKTIPFSADDDGGDLVETSFVAQGLVALKNYFAGTDDRSVQIRTKAEALLADIDWNWYRHDGQNVLYWHWSPNYAFQKNMKITGWNECLVTYVMAASSAAHAIPREVYDEGWTRGGAFANLRTYYGFNIRLAPDYGGPLFWIHYSHLGINPKGLTDPYADYWQEHVNTAKIHHAYAVANPQGFKNYSDQCWGLTASDDPYGYSAHQPVGNDNGTVSPTAALSSMPYLPDEAIRALKYFYRERGQTLLGKYGFYDAFNDQQSWVDDDFLGIDQGPIVVMIENYRTGLLWKQVMNDSDVQAGLTKLGFRFEVPTAVTDWAKTELRIFPNPFTDRVRISRSGLSLGNELLLTVVAIDGRVRKTMTLPEGQGEVEIDCSALPKGIYVLRVSDGMHRFGAKLIKQ